MMIRNRALDRLRTFVTLIALTTSVLSLWLMYSVQQPQDTSPPWVSVAVSSEDTGRGRRDTGSDVIKDGGGRLKDALAGFEIGADVYNFNVSLSEGISLSRDIPDTRPAICKDRQYDLSSLPRVSIIIPFYNEAWSTLLRTLHSILNRTPRELLKEIILVDDASKFEYLLTPLRRYVKVLSSKVKLLRNPVREGLIKSRMNGFEISTGEVIVFLDAHTEVNVQWYEPLALRLQTNPNSVIQPFVDGIDQKTMIYAGPVDVHKGAFTWDLRYVWMQVPAHVQRGVMEDGAAYASITLVGCAIAVRRHYFARLGGFDVGMKVWGGENIELAFRAWMCGGSVETVPCSRIGHLFRAIPYQADIKSGQRWQRNLMRIADLWMGDYKKYFYSSTMIYSVNRVKASSEDIETLKERILLKERLGCHTFEWFLTSVAVEVTRPPRGALYHGEIVNKRTAGCWSVKDDGYIDINEVCYEHKLLPENEFTMTREGLLLYRERCVYHDRPTPNLRVRDCRPDDEGAWSMLYSDSTWGEIRLRRGRAGGATCIQHATSVVAPHNGQQMAQTSTCSDGGDDFQMWAFTYRFDFNASMYYT